MIKNLKPNYKQHLFLLLKSTKMHYDNFDQKRKEKKKFLRLKIITNRDFNFITAVRPDSTITDLANRALNAYLQLSQQNRSKKQLTVSAVKQGRYFMPKSQIVSNLLTQDEEVQIIIVKAKPKFPQQHIPTHHDFQILTKKIKNFDDSLNKKPFSTNSKIKFETEKIKNQNNILCKSSENSIDGSNLESKSSQLQHSKRQRKNKKKQQKKLKKLKNLSHQHKVLKDQIDINKENCQSRNSQRKIQKMQGQLEISEHKLSNISQSIPLKITQNKSLDIPSKNNGQNQKQQNLSLFNSRSVDRSNQKQNGSKNVIKFPQPSKRDFINTYRQISEEKIDETKKKHKHEHSAKHQNQQISRKGSVDRYSQKTPKMNPLQSPKIVFHFETKHESPKVIYIPESKTMSEMKENIQKEKQKMKTMSPLLLPKNSPRISVFQDPFQKINDSSRNQLSIQNKKMKNQAGERKSSIQNQQQVNEPHNQKDTFRMDREISPRVSTLPVNTVQQRKSSCVMQPEIIEEQSSEQQIIYSFMKLPNQNNSGQKGKKQTQNNRLSKQNESTIKKKSNVSSKFFQIENLINKFKLEESDDENN